MFIADAPEQAVQALYEVLLATFQRGNKLLVFGCGGSASTATHLAHEFVAHWTGVQLPALSLCNDVPLLTCLANDHGFDRVYAKQLAAFAQKGDFVIGISTAGDAPAVIEGLLWARDHQLQTSAWTGKLGVKFSRLSDFPVIVNREWVGTIQERHLELAHLVSDMVCKTLLNTVPHPNTRMATA